MPHVPLSFVVPDASPFARSLGQALKRCHAEGLAPPGHVELLNLIARALGHRNLQSLQAEAAAAWPGRPAAAAVDVTPAAPVAVDVAPAPPSPARQSALPEPPLAAEDRPPPLPLTDNARKALMQFDSRGRLLRWPTKYSVQKLAMWVLWTLFDSRRSYTEREVNEVLKAANAFGDHVTLRRELINHRLMSRKSDCTDYRKLPAEPDAEARALLQAWRAQRHASRPLRTERPDSPRRRQAAAAAAAAAATAAANGPSASPA